MKKRQLKWLNNQRLRDYPRLIFVASWLVLILNAIFHQGWVGGLTGVMIGGDFISNYSAGTLYKTDISHLYDPTTQQLNQESLIAPSNSPGFAPFISPPYDALAFSLIQAIPLKYAFILWELVNLVCVLVSAYLLSNILFPTVAKKGSLSKIQLSIIILSSFAIVTGFIAGQSHGIILMLVTGILFAMFKGKWILAGFMGSLLVYKPQFVIGFIICWVMWGCYKSLLSFGIFTILWQIPVLLAYGVTPYREYLNFTNLLLYLPYAKDGFPISLLATPYAFIATLFPIDYSNIIKIIFIILGVMSILFLFYVAYNDKKTPIHKRYFTFTGAILLPLVISPHILVYDLIILVPVLLLLANYDNLSQAIKVWSIIIYICLLFLPLIGYITRVAIIGIFPLALFCYYINSYFRTNRIARVS